MTSHLTNIDAYYTKDISVVIPAYNAERTIAETLYSALNQNTSNFSFEVILVDDGSKDGTLRIAEGIAQNNPALRIFTQQNSGSPSKPRNIGIELAHGKYILFLDADDYLCQDALISMHQEVVSTKNQIILGKFIGKNGRKTPLHIFKKTIHDADLLEDNAWHNLSPTAKLCDLHCIRKHNLSFFEDQWIGEDQNFFAALFLKSSGISILSDKNYVEIGWQDNGINLTSKQQRLEDKAKTSIRLGSVIRENTLPGTVRNRLTQRIFTSTLPSVINQFYSLESPYSRQKFVYNMHHYLSDLYTDQHRKNLDTKVKIGFDLLFAGLVDDLDLLLCNKSRFDIAYDFDDAGNLGLVLPQGLSQEALSILDRSLPKSGLITSQLGGLFYESDKNTNTKILNIVGDFKLDKIKAKPSNFEIVLIERNTKERLIFPVIYETEFDASIQSWRLRFHWFIDHEVNIPQGIWGTFFCITWVDGTICEDRWGKRTVGIENEKFPVEIKNNTLIAYFNNIYENLTLDVGFNIHHRDMI